MECAAFMKIALSRKTIYSFSEADKKKLQIAKSSGSVPKRGVVKKSSSGSETENSRSISDKQIPNHTSEDNKKKIKVAQSSGSVKKRRVAKKSSSGSETENSIIRIEKI